MDIQRLAAEAKKVMQHIYSMPYRDHRLHGMEYRRGWFNIFNEEAGQSRVVLYHPKSGYIFKPHAWNEPANSSRKVLGTVDLDGIEYTVRLPEYHVVGDIQVAEHVPCNTCCPSQKGWCHHSKVMSESGICGSDPHAGNYRVVGNEIIMIDFEDLGEYEYLGSD